MFVGSVATVESVKSYRLRRVFNFQKELKRVRKNNKQPKPIKQNGLPEGTFIGFDGRRAIYIPDNAKHVFVPGTTGSGKTVALSNFMKRAIDKGFPSLIIDGKGDLGDGSLYDAVHKLNQGAKKVYVINLSDPENSDKYNPFLGASSAMATDMLINMTDWSEPHYKLNAERYIQRITQLLELAKIPLSFGRIVACMKPSKFTDLCNYLLKKELVSKDEHIDNLELLKTSGKIAQSSVARFSTIAESLVGKILSDDGINIAQALKENAIILFILNPMVYPELSPAFGRLALIDSKIAIGELYKTRVARTFFMFDEISTYASPVLTDILGKSRSANVLCILASQSLSDLDFAVNQAFKEQIIENCNNFLTMRQNSGVNAEYLANLIGTKETIEVTHQLQQHGLDASVTGYGSARRVREFLYHPDVIKALQTGVGIFLSRDTNTHCKVNIYKPF